MKYMLDRDIRLLVDLAVSRFRTRQFLSRAKASIETTRRLLREMDRLSGPLYADPDQLAPDPASEGALASPTEPA